MASPSSNDGLDFSKVEIDGYRPGAMGDIIALHARYYAVHWGFGAAFEAYVARDMESLLSDFRDDRDRMLFAYHGGRALGSACLDGRKIGPEGQTQSARLRFILLDPCLAGKGVGRQMITSIVDWAREAGDRHLWLTTFEGLDAARHLYEAVGFSLTDAYPGETYGVQMIEQRFDWSA